MHLSQARAPLASPFVIAANCALSRRRFRPPRETEPTPNRQPAQAHHGSGHGASCAVRPAAPGKPTTTYQRQVWHRFPGTRLTKVEWSLQALKQACSQEYPESAMCVQSLDDSLDSAIRITYRISLRSSSLREPRHPPLKVFLEVLFCLSCSCAAQGVTETCLGL